MGIPIGSEYTFVDGHDMGNKTGLAFYVTESSPPKPNNPNIDIRKVPAGSQYYVRSVFYNTTDILFINTVTPLANAPLG